MFKTHPFTILIIVLFCFINTASAQQISVSGHISDHNERAIEFCVVHNLTSKDQTYADQNGNFSIKSTVGDTLIFFCLGYEKKTAIVKENKIDIFLESKLHEIENVSVSAKKIKGKRIEKVMGKRNLKPSGICTGLVGNEKSIYLSADSSRHGLLKQISFYITKDGYPKSKFRVHVYDIDSNYLPGKDLLDSNVILNATIGDEWVSVDVSSQRISVGRGVFISMEWISGFGNETEQTTSANYTAQSPFNGQVLAFTNDYYKQQSLYYRRNNNQSVWHFCSLGGTSKRNILNPMIFATYTYYK